MQSNTKSFSSSEEEQRHVQNKWIDQIEQPQRNQKLEQAQDSRKLILRRQVLNDLIQNNDYINFTQVAMSFKIKENLYQNKHIVEFESGKKTYQIQRFVTFFVSSIGLISLSDKYRNENRMLGLSYRRTFNARLLPLFIGPIFIRATLTFLIFKPLFLRKVNNINQEISESTLKSIFQENMDFLDKFQICQIQEQDQKLK